MVLKERLQELGKEKGKPCVSISLNTHRTHPDNAQDEILLKNLLHEAEERVTREYDKRSVAHLLENIKSVQKEIDANYNLDSLNVFLSNDTKEIIRSPWPVTRNRVEISETFAVRPLIRSFNRMQPYLIMVLSQNGVHLYETVGSDVVNEIKNKDFPYGPNEGQNHSADRKSDGEYQDDLIREYFNNIDKAVVRVHNENHLNCVVLCTVDNYSLLQQVADKPGIYLGHVNIDYNHTARHEIGKQAWKLMETIQKQQNAEAINEVKDAVSQGHVITDLQEIYQAAIDGRGDLLIVHQNFVQPVKMMGERNFELIDNPETAGAIDDITSNIAWEVMSKKGRAVFTAQDEIKDLGKIALKTRY